MKAHAKIKLRKNGFKLVEQMILKMGEVDREWR